MKRRQVCEFLMALTSVSSIYSVCHCGSTLIWHHSTRRFRGLLLYHGISFFFCFYAAIQALGRERLRITDGKKEPLFVECHLSVFLLILVLFPLRPPFCVWFGSLRVFLFILTCHFDLLRGMAGFQAGARKSRSCRYRLPSVYVWSTSKAVFEYIIPRPACRSITVITVLRRLLVCRLEMNVLRTLDISRGDFVFTLEHLMYDHYIDIDLYASPT